MRQDREKRFERYASQVDKAFRDRIGIAYSFIRGDLESSELAPRLEDAVNHDLDPAEFAERVSNRFALRDTSDRDAVPFNRRIAALVLFSSVNPEWSLGRDGGIYRDGPVGIERLYPSRDVEGRRFGFGASVSSDGTLKADEGEVVEMSGEFEPWAGAIDIGDAIERLESRYDRGFGM